MIGDNTWLPERDLASVEPIGFKILVEVIPEKPKSSIIHMPDRMNKNDTTRKSFWARIVKVGRKVEGTVPGLKVAMDPSLDIMSQQRCFRWEGKHYMLADVSDIIMVMEETHVEEKAAA